MSLGVWFHMPFNDLTDVRILHIQGLDVMDHFKLEHRCINGLIRFYDDSCYSSRRLIEDGTCKKIVLAAGKSVPRHLDGSNRFRVWSIVEVSGHFTDFIGLFSIFRCFDTGEYFKSVSFIEKRYLKSEAVPHLCGKFKSVSRLIHRWSLRCIFSSGLYYIL